MGIVVLNFKVKKQIMISKFFGKGKVKGPLNDKN